MRKNIIFALLFFTSTAEVYAVTCLETWKKSKNRSEKVYRKHVYPHDVHLPYVFSTEKVDH